MRIVRILADLTKVRISLAVLLSTITGYIVYSGELTTKIILPCLGLFILACGASALNQYQERDIDSLMDRTKGRPIPNGEISSFIALLISLILIIAGVLILYLDSGILSAALGVLNLIWYNAFYTVLKKRTAFAVVPGSLTGAIPPIIGWIAAGGYLFDPQIMFLAFFLFIWQIPHFWVLLIKFGKDYQKANLPSLITTFSMVQLKRITYIWIVSLAITSLLFPYFKMVQEPILIIFNSLLALGVIISFYFLLFRKNKFSFRSVFLWINLFLLLFLMLLILESIVNN